MGLHSQINLVNTTNRNYYFPGETLNGNIVVTSDSDVKVKGLKLRIHGKGKVKFTEKEQRFHDSIGAHSNTLKLHSQHTHHHHSTSSSSSSEYIDVEYSEEETYLDITLNILGYDGGEWTIKSGRFTYPFQFTLPFGLPSSFVGEFGSIEYSLEMVIGKSWAFDYKSLAFFQVVSVVDLNVEPTAQVPIIVKACKTFGVIFQSGPLDITLRIPKGGAVPGEYVPFIAEIFNKSDRTVTECLSIHKEIEYIARGRPHVAR
ncbi:arrestin domain-containing protein 17-like [Bradysia coprophila]|uniref:arrestin domain-containing protein 17-like n=1 Tax=Bradysia coprophila TaxID=38358 RepID=UPI00187D7E26|nr:arrestin domain-containing protein 17-like [Bradysia coprophila]XP_037039871.1 arrestin domain-containing protein 17-like [Bradysia coprophila]